MLTLNLIFVNILNKINAYILKLLSVVFFVVTGKLHVFDIHVSK